MNFTRTIGLLFVLLFFVQDALALPGSVSISVSPNPFNPYEGQKTKILLKAKPGMGTVDLRVHAKRGTVVCKGLHLREEAPGEYTTLWDGRDDLHRLLLAGEYLLRVFPSKKYGRLHASCKVIVQGLSPPRPNPFIPTGKNSMRVSCQGAPGHKNLVFRLQRVSQGWRRSVEFYDIFLAEGNIPGLYNASWKGIAPGDYIVPDGHYSIHFYTPSEEQLPTQGRLRIRNIDSLSVRPNQFHPESGESVTITAAGIAGLKLEARLLCLDQITSTYRLVRTLGMSEKRGLYTAVWDGMGEDQKYVAPAKYNVEVRHVGSQVRYYPTAHVTVSSLISSVKAARDSFVPTGTNSVKIIVKGPPGQSGLSLRFQKGAIVWSNYMGGYDLPLAETSTPGVYAASWDAVSAGNTYIMPSGAYTILVCDQGGHKLPVSGRVTVKGVDSIAASPNPFNPEGGEVTDITVKGAKGLKLEVRVVSATLPQKVLKILPLVEKKGGYSARWDGRDRDGKLVPLGEYRLEVCPVGRSVRYHPVASLSISAGISTITATPDPFLPTGLNNTKITIKGPPGQKGLALRFYTEAFPHWWKNARGGYDLPLTETSIPGEYSAEWDAVFYGNRFIMSKGEYMVYAYDSVGNQLPTTGNITLAGISSVAISPSSFTPGGDSHITITVKAEHGLKLEARIFQGEKAPPIRILPLREGEDGIYTAEWDGRDKNGKYPGANTYQVKIYPAGSKVPYYHPDKKVMVKPAIYSIAVAPEPFVPTGANHLTIMVTGDPLQQGLNLLITHPEGGTSPKLPLKETSEPGTYEAQWDGIINGIIPRQAQCKITVFDSSGNPFPLEGTFLLNSAMEITVTPDPYIITGDKKAVITVHAADGLNLVAKIGKVVSLPLSRSGRNTYVATWDGRDSSGQRVSFGEYKVTLWNVASDIRYDVDATMEVTVDNKPPVLKPIGQQTISEGERLIFKVSATDPDGDALDFSVKHLPLGAKFDPETRVFNWKPNYDQAGLYTITFIVTDNGIPPMSDFEKVLFKVENVNRPPILQHIGPQSVDEGQLLTILLVAMDPDREPLKFQASNLPKGAIFKDYGDGTAIFKWTPGYGEAGKYTVIFTVCEKVASVNCAFERVTITVNRVKPRAKVPGDLNRDNKVNKKDYDLFFKSLGTCRGEKGFNLNADYDNDGCITFVDYQIWSKYYSGKATPLP